MEEFDELEVKRAIRLITNCIERNKLSHIEAGLGMLMMIKAIEADLGVTFSAREVLADDTGTEH